MNNLFTFDDVTGNDDPEETRRPGPLWRHALWVVGITLGAVAAGWVAAAYRLGPAEYGIPSAAPGSPWVLLAWSAAAGLIATTLLRATAARIPVYAPGRVGFVPLFLGTRLALGFRPEPPVLAAGAAALAAVALAWCVVAAVTHRRAGYRTA
ncbi:hypothetical protein ACFWBC_25105 [Streptomyces sp. NPDC059985]|uniref:hypothetical protein n=1 Tax=Streptomyces sp. NPDC059985 TaxID=3347025 RepID=UPI0036C8060D